MDRLPIHSLGARVDLAGWLAERLTAIGLESGEDLELMLPGDLTYPDLEPQQRQWLDANFPREVSLGDARYRVEYDPAAMQITLVTVSGTRKAPPQSGYLPAWPGWRVVHREKSRIHVVRPGR